MTNTNAQATASAAARGGSALGWLGVILVILKLDPGSHLTSAVVGWPWWLVLMPFWLWVAILLVIAAIGGAIFAVVGVLDWLDRRKRRKARAAKQAEHKSRIEKQNKDREERGLPPLRF